MSLPFFSDCVGWPRDRLGALNYLIRNGKTITRRTFLAHVDREVMREWEQEHYGGTGLTMASDWAVGYERLGPDVYWFNWSAIEHVFATPEAIDHLEELAQQEDLEYERKAGCPCADEGSCPAGGS